MLVGLRSLEYRRVSAQEADRLGQTAANNLVRVPYPRRQAGSGFAMRAERPTNSTMSAAIIHSMPDVMNATS